MDGFPALYEQMLPEVYRYTTTRTGSTVGEELCGDVFHAAVAAIREGRDVSPAWLMGVARNKVVDHWRREELRRRASSVDLRWSRPTAPSAEDEVVERLGDTVEALDRLPTRHRTLLALRYLDDLTVAELARRTGQSPAAVESALARARRALRQVLEERVS